MLLTASVTLSLALYSNVYESICFKLRMMVVVTGFYILVLV